LVQPTSRLLDALTVLIIWDKSKNSSQHMKPEDLQFPVLAAFEQAIAAILALLQFLAYCHQYHPERPQ